MDGREEREESREREGETGGQSRSDRWKAKHEAMLKQAEEEGRGPKQVLETSGLVITLNETTRREEGEAEETRLGRAGEGAESGRLKRAGGKIVVAV